MPRRTAQPTPTAQPPTAPPPLVVALVNQKGGVGKTTLAVNLAAAAHLEGRRALLLDLDEQRNVADWAASRAEGSRLSGLVALEHGHPLRARDFADLAKPYAVAVLDAPGDLGPVMSSAALVADVAVIPLRPGPFDWWACTETIELLDKTDEYRAQVDRGPVRRIYVLNAVDRRAGATASAIDAIKQTMGVDPVVIASRTEFVRSAAAGESVLTTAPESPAAAELLALWSAIQ